MALEFPHPGFPNSYIESITLTSPRDERYNCIAWACEVNTNYVWPGMPEDTFWPPGIPRELKLGNFILLFNKLGYETCENGELEEGFLKVAIFCDENNTPEHAARQLPSGLWTSKIGHQEDVSHSIFAINNGVYGNVEVYMKRKT